MGNIDPEISDNFCDPARFVALFAETARKKFNDWNDNTTPDNNPNYVTYSDNINVNINPATNKFQFVHDHFLTMVSRLYHKETVIAGWQNWINQ